MTESLNAFRRALMGKARNLAEQAQRNPVGLIRGDLVKIPYEDLVDMFILVAEVCPPELLTMAPAVDVIPCQGCEVNIPATVNGRRYCSEACRNRVKSQNLMDRRAAA